jgi:hypothetical protein
MENINFWYITLCSPLTRITRRYIPEVDTRKYCRAYSGDYIRRGIGLSTKFIGSQSITHLQPSLLQLQLTLTTESQLLLSFSRAQDLLQTQLALTGHQLTLQPSSATLLPHCPSVSCNCKRLGCV